MCLIQPVTDWGTSSAESLIVYQFNPIIASVPYFGHAKMRDKQLQIPFNFQDPDKPRRLLLNPEYDFLHVKVQGSPGIFADFLHDAKAYDPMGVGILNLGIGDIEPENLKLPLIPSSIDPQALPAFTSTLRALNTIFFRHVAHSETRQLLESVDMEAVRYSLSYPLNSSTEIFDLLPADPRPINADLDVISVGWDPRAPFCLWRKLERGFNISRSQPPDFQFLITAHSEEEFPIKSRTGAARFLKAEREGWEKLWKKGGLFGTLGYEPEIPQEPFSVFGFWMFPMDAFGDLPSEEFDGVRWDMKVVANLGKYRPQLGVFRLPSE